MSIKGVMLKSGSLLTYRDSVENATDKPLSMAEILAAELSEAQEKIRELESKLLKTKDGKNVWIGDIVYYKHPGSNPPYICEHKIEEDVWAVGDWDDDGIVRWTKRASQCYSSKELAEGAEK